MGVKNSSALILSTTNCIVNTLELWFFLGGGQKNFKIDKNRRITLSTTLPAKPFHGFGLEQFLRKGKRHNGGQPAAGNPPWHGE